MIKDRVFLSPPHLGTAERELLLDTIDSNWAAPLESHVDVLECEFSEKLGVGHAVAVSSGTAALHLALLVVGAETGDTVLVSSLTSAATVNAIRYVGAEPVLLDSERESWNLDPQHLEADLREGAACGRLPIAVIVVDICGQCANWGPIRYLCQKYGVPMIEDAAQSLGATYRNRPAGTLGDVGCFSLGSNKIITTSAGGMLVTDSAEWAASARHLATQARDSGLHHQHSQVGYNYRLSELLAAVGRGQLQVLDDRVARRRGNFEFYRQALADLPGIEFMPEAPFGQSTRWLTCLLIDRDAYGVTPAQVCAAMAAEHIEARPLWKPMHQQPAFAECRVRGGEVADDIFQRGLFLPSGSNLSQADRARVVDVFRSALIGRRHRAAA